MNKVTSTAPERIWLQVSDDADDCDLPFTYTYSDEVTWCEDSVTACQVEYVRADITEAENAALRVERDAAFALLRVCQDSVHPDTRTVILALIGDTALCAGKEKP